VFGSGSGDVITGDNADNHLYGLGGSDTLTGGTGQDQLIGGAGADTFAFTALNESTLAAPDDIADFSAGEVDKIDLSAIDANTGSGGDQAFNFIGNNNFNGTAGQLHYQGGYIEGDVNGDSVADFRIQAHPATLASTDFIL
jgi:serralysin